ncbi:poly [ADP-ribose] polymerase tankyrase-2 isoform X1 [Drosophila montana]|uniref:poly [ADP-ribose] polymerase tankyrase-2 isoform X1 n=1 Tax=Drosophila montana TaxID=40370 RepID=UPI00313BCEBB
MRNSLQDVIAATPSLPEKEQRQQQQPDTEEQDLVQDNDGGDSLTSSLAIEGFVQGASEDYTVQSQTAAYEVDDEDTRLQQIIESGDMEQLAEIVLNGEGARLLGLKSKEPEIQAFLNNVPSYMEKIHRVHDAARDGSLLALQQALDRRKFAIAKDDISPNGATPLHVAVLFGHSDIVRYLASRFPETMAITDNDGRTPLHYAATIKDNGHFYNVLSQLGANPKALDKLGHTPEFYVDMEKSKDVLTYTELLTIFGAEELENQLLSDQGQSQPVSFQGNPIFKTEQGKYLADSLADPLIKALTEIANKRPKDPVAYLTGYLQQFMGQRKPITEAVVHSGSSKTSSSSTAVATSISKVSSSRTGKNHADIIELDARSLAEQQEDDEDAALAVQHLEERDEHGQSMLHFACARSHRRGALYTLIEESRIDVSYRDELYRTARDVALQANQPNNAAEIDRYVLAQAVLGDVEPFDQLALQGYDHILDVEDENGKSIMDVAAERRNEALVAFLNSLRVLEETREELHQVLRDKNMERLKELTAAPNAKWLIKTKNYYGRTALHIAVLKESEEMVQHLVQLCPEALKVTDNLERTVLHYALGTNFCESVSRILIQNGAKRTAKDLKGRQPSYYFINKADILRLQEEEEESR